jgi:uncharacterized surface protein with fasciclin (FAS1) repeats
MNKIKYAFLLGIMFVGGLLVSCTDDIADDAHYKPNKASGNAYETLLAEGNHSMFLRGVDLSGYKPVVNGKSLLTVIAPDDNAFSTFLKKKGVSSIDELYNKDPQYLNRLITFHLMYYSFDWDKMVNFRPIDGDAATEEQRAVNAGYYYKHRTYSSDPIETKRVKLTPNATTDTLLRIYHYERYLPVFSNQLFATKGIDPSYNYSYFFPETPWGAATPDGLAGEFNIANAQVVDKGYEITQNGYLYHVNQVIEPLNTIYDELKSREKYSDFLSIYDQYSTYVKASDETNASLGYEAYVHTHGELPSIALEWPVTNALSTSTLERGGYNLFAPSNVAMDNFFKSFWTADGGYKSISDLDPMILRYFIMQSFSGENFIAFPEEIKKGTVLTVYNTPINVDPDQVVDRVMCENGTLYGMDNMDAPAIFTSVVGPSFKDKKFIDYLYTLDGSELMLSLASRKSQFVSLIPSNTQYENSDPQMRLYTTTSGKELQQYSTDAGDYVGMSKNAMLNIVNMHSASNISSLPTDGTAVIPTNVAYNYWYVHNGMITSNALFNEQLNPEFEGSPFVAFHKLTNDGKDWVNGSAYSYDAKRIFKPVSGDGLAHLLAVGNDKNYKYYLFAQLLKKAGLIEGAAFAPNFIPEDSLFISFIPTNEAIKENIKKLPGCGSLRVTSSETLEGNVAGTNKTKLAAYLRNYFIRIDMNPSISTYPYIGSSCKGEFFTVGGNNKLRIADNGSKLSVSLIGTGYDNKVVDVSSEYFYLPFAFSDGCFHLIDGVLL